MSYKQTIKWLLGCMASVAGIALAIIEIRAAHIKTERLEEKAGAGYESLAAAVTELQDLVGDVETWSERTDAELDEMADRMSELEAELREVRGDIESEAEAAMRRVVESMPEPAKAKLKRPERSVPPDLDNVQQMAK